MKPTKTIAFISLCGLMLFVVIVFLLHFLRSDKNMLSCFVSEYAVGNYSWLMTIAFYALAFAATLLLIALLQNIEASVTSSITTGIFCVGILLVAIFPTDVPVEPASPRGLVHGFTALIALISLGISMIAWGVVFKKNNTLKKLVKPSIFLEW
jgi:phosphate/sulfate permease